MSQSIQNETLKLQEITTDNDDSSHPQSADEADKDEELFPSVPRRDDYVQKDSSRSWLVCISSASVACVLTGLYSSFGLFLVEFLREFQENEAKTAWVASMANSVHYLCCLLAGVLRHYFQTRTILLTGSAFIVSGLTLTSYVRKFDLLYLTFGIVYGLGTGLSQCLLIASVPDYFKERVSLATGIIYAGMSLGSILYPTLGNYLIQRFGWRTALRLLASFDIFVVLCAFTFKRKKFSTHAAQDSTSGKFKQYLVLVRQRYFLIWVASVGAMIGVVLVPHYFIIAFSKDLGSTVSEGSRLVMYYGISAFLSQLLTGYGADFVRKKIKVYVYLLLIMVLTNAQVSFSSSHWQLVLFSVLDGFAVGGLTTLVTPCTIEVVHGNDFIYAWGLLSFFISFFQMAAPPLAGAFLDHFQTYAAVFLFRAGSLSVAALLALIVLCVGEQRREARQA